ncbi:MAG: hypothetical protein DWQ06_00625 [Calditrichaeota bacterium]|nr:MAG: hypothetical protein DWQ06_00625 [Calditrichota bacterium]
MRKKPIYKLEFYLVKFISFLANKFNFQTSIKFGKLLGKLILLLGIRRKLVFKQLIEVLGEEKAKTLLPKVYENLGINSVAFLRSKKFPNEQKIANPKEYLKIVNTMKSGKGVLVLSAHIGNWELMGRKALDYFPATSFVNIPKNPFVANLILEQRGTKNAEFLEAKPSNFFAALEVLKKGKVLSMIVDQHPGRKGVEVEFLGMKTLFNRTFEKLVEVSEAEVFTAFILQKDGKHFLEIEKIEGKVETVKRKTEEIILQNPEQYFWLHNRWK